MFVKTTTPGARKGSQHEFKIHLRNELKKLNNKNPISCFIILKANQLK